MPDRHGRQSPPIHELSSVLRYQQDKKEEKSGAERDFGLGEQLRSEARAIEARRGSGKAGNG